jgi:hypothetical protein
MYLGLFGATSGADIENLTIEYPNLTATSSYPSIQWLGGLAASATDTLINNVHVRGTIRYTASNALYMGGLVGGAGGSSGSSEETSISASSFAGTLDGTGAQDVSVGGILGTLNNNSDDARIEESYATGTIRADSSSATAFAGGIAGNGDCFIENCYTAARVDAYAPSSTAAAGGIIGNLSTTVTGFGKCYALGPVKAEGGSTTYAGGIAGVTNIDINNCVALADVDGGISEYVGRVIGFHAGIYAGTNYAASEKTITSGPPNTNVVDGTPHPGANLQGSGNQSKYETDLGWVFENTPGYHWKWVNGYDYPVLAWQDGAPDV